MADVAVVLLDGKGQILAGEELVFEDETMKAFPVVGQEGVPLDADFIAKFLTEPAPAKALGSVHIFVPFPVMPAKAGTQGPHMRLLAGVPLGPRFRGDDE